MTISELRIALDLSFDDKVKVLKRHVKQMLNKKYLFVDSADGSCYLFDEDGNENDIAKLDCIETDLFYNDESLKLVRIPDSVTTIKSYAFSHCSNLIRVTIPNSVTYIESWAFYDCCGISSMTIPDSVMGIEYSAFECCSGLINVTIGNHVTSIGDSAFSNCSNLKKLIFKGKSIDEVKAMKDYPWGIKDESVIRCES